MQDWRGYLFLAVLLIVAIAIITRGCDREDGNGGNPVPFPERERAIEIDKRTPEESAADAARQEADRVAAVARAEKARQQARRIREAEAAEREAQEQKRLRQIYETVTKDDGFDLIKDGLDEWGVSLAIKSKDENRLRFEGTARLRWRMPFEDVAVEGKTDEKGRAVISGVDPIEPVILDKISSLGQVTGGRWLVEPSTARRKDKRKVRDERLMGLMGQSFTPTMTLWDQKERIECIAELKLLNPRAQIWPGKHEETRRWFDGKFDDGWAIGKGNVSVSVRYTEPVVTDGILFVYFGYANTVKGVVESGSMEVIQ